MLQRLKNKVKDQRGLTLIELLAVIVILGIIAAIAIPSVLGIIDNTKKDAHVANAQELVSAARVAVSQNTSLQGTGTEYLTLGYLVGQNLLDTVKDPDNTSGGYLDGGSSATAAPQTTVPTTGSYVVVANGKVTQVKLVNGTRGVQSAATNGTSVSVDSLSRSSVN
ncbi:MAG: prepilin-type N-terminal cleavage/methylation domain-containing protein [Bacillota bacterium]|nr:prepilin-type N-terminal cleavage/methylation domain-containing protein [Bacillota bacterium]